jgi:hypothetical protein
MSRIPYLSLDIAWPAGEGDFSCQQNAAHAKRSAFTAAMCIVTQTSMAAAFGWTIGILRSILGTG